MFGVLILAGLFSKASPILGVLCLFTLGFKNEKER